MVTSSVEKCEAQKRGKSGNQREISGQDTETITTPSPNPTQTTK